MMAVIRPSMTTMISTMDSTLQGKHEQKLFFSKFLINNFSLYQFWILLLRCLRCIMRDQMLTQLRFISHVLIGGAIGLLYMDIGDKGSMVQQNISLIFLVLLFLVSFELDKFYFRWL